MEQTSGSVVSRETKRRGETSNLKPYREDFLTPASQLDVSKKSKTISDQFLDIESDLAAKLCELIYLYPVTHVYNPIQYAFTVHSQYVKQYCFSEKSIMILGMNPGPWGMCQTGVPFGEVNIVKDWLGISGEIGRPERENSKKPVKGFASKRSEISGQRFWNIFKELCGEAKNFFDHTLVYNHCPIAFMSESGKNITPPELKVEERKTLIDLCDEALRKVVTLFQISVVIAVGKYAEKRSLNALRTGSMDHIKVILIPHPSPRNFGNADKWKDIVIETLQTHELMNYFKKC